MKTITIRNSIFNTAYICEIFATANYNQDLRRYEPKVLISTTNEKSVIHFVDTFQDKDQATEYAKQIIKQALTEANL